MAELNEILSGQTTEPVTERARGEDGRFTTATPAESVPEPTPEPVPAPVAAAAPVVEPVVDHVPQAALLDERRKRQQYERELSELREQMRAQTQPKPEPPKDVWEDPAAYISAETKRARDEAVREAQEMMRHQMANLSEQQARARHADYDEKSAAFAARIESDPVLRSELNRVIVNGDDLGEFVYKTASRLQEVEQVGNFDAYRQKVESEIRSKLEAEFAARKPVVPQSLNGEPSPSSTTETWKGPAPLEQILKRK